MTGFTQNFLLVYVFVSIAAFIVMYMEMYALDRENGSEPIDASFEAFEAGMIVGSMWPFLIVIFLITKAAEAFYQSMS